MFRIRIARAKVKLKQLLTMFTETIHIMRIVRLTVMEHHTRHASVR